MYKAWWIFPYYHRGQIHSVVRVGDSNPGFPHSKPQLWPLSHASSWIRWQFMQKLLDFVLFFPRETGVESWKNSFFTLENSWSVSTIHLYVYPALSSCYQSKHQLRLFKISFRSTCSVIWFICPFKNLHVSPSINALFRISVHLLVYLREFPIFFHELFYSSTIHCLIPSFILCMSVDLLCMYLSIHFFGYPFIHSFI